MPANWQHGKDSRGCGQRTGAPHAAKGTGRFGFPSWSGSIGLAIAIAIAYFLAARLSLALLTDLTAWRCSGPPQVSPRALLIALGPGAGCQ